MEIKRDDFMAKLIRETNWMKVNCPHCGREISVEVSLKSRVRR